MNNNFKFSKTQIAEIGELSRSIAKMKNLRELSLEFWYFEII